MTSGKNWRVLLGKDDRDQKKQESDGTKERKLREINSLGFDRFGVIPVFLAYWRRNILVDQYRVVVWGTGVVYDGTKSEAMRQFNLFVVQSKNAKSESDRRSVTLFKNFEMIREHRPLDQK